MCKRLFSQLILLNMILLACWFSVKTAETNRKAATLTFQEMIKIIYPDFGQAQEEYSVAFKQSLIDKDDYAHFILPKLPRIKVETIQIIADDIFSRKPESIADGRRIVEYSVLENTKIHLSDEDYEILLKIVEAEAGIEDEIGRMLVAGVVLNRVNSEIFPNTVKDVVYQKLNDTYQFSPVANGRIKRAKVTTETIKAVDKVLLGTDHTEGALFFASRKYADPIRMKWFDRNLIKLFTHGGHDFFTL
ncbi:MAG: cell wall hydrolase [Lachnospiraceae bacterium]|nr:cell wall hydrolase [Lachnospiraceae bacterium]